MEWIQNKLLLIRSAILPKMSDKEKTTLNTERPKQYLHFIITPLKLGGCWDFYSNMDNEMLFIINNMYLALVFFVFTYIPVALAVYLYLEWEDIFSSLHKIADSLPITVTCVIVAYNAIYRGELYELFGYMNKNFKYHSARGLTNMSMYGSCNAAWMFGKMYTSCTMFSVTMYAVMPLVLSWWTKEPMQTWFLVGTSRYPFLDIGFIMSCLGQFFVGIAMGQSGVFFAANSILICGQLDLLCCSLRNAKYTALLQNGVKHSALAAAHADIQDDEKHNYTYNMAEMKASIYHYDEKMGLNIANITSQFNIYATEHDAATMDALRDCASLSQVVTRYTEMFERFMSPLLALRVVQVTLYICTLLYAATVEFEMTTAEYLAAVTLDTFIYCYYGNQIILQADRVSTAAYQSAWHTMGVRPRKVLLNILLANKNPAAIRAGNFLQMDLHTFINIIKTSFSYYTLLVNVNENQ